MITPQPVVSSQYIMNRRLTKGPDTLTSFLVPVAGASQIAPVNWRVCHANGTRISLVPVGFNIAHVLFVCRQLAPETSTGYWYQKTGQCVWPFTPNQSKPVSSAKHFGDGQRLNCDEAIKPIAAAVSTDVK